MAPPISEARVALGRLAVVATVVAWLSYFVTWLIGEFISSHGQSTRYKVEAFVYLVVVTLLTASALAYLCCRLGYFYRSRDHQRVPRAAIDDFFSRIAPTLTVIIPSYKEESRVIRSTLLSAALQEYPYQRVVLLIDDPPNPRSKADRRTLAAARALPAQLRELLAGPCAQFTAALEAFESNRDGANSDLDAMTILADHYDWAVSWCARQADAEEIVDHTDRFFVDQVLRGLSADFTVTASALRGAAAEGVVLPPERLRQLYRRLVWTFRVEISSFERKQYASLSHDANKAMNLNSYLGLMGGSYRDVVSLNGRVLVPAAAGSSDLDVPDPDYVLTLDADSILLPEYCLRLVHLMEQSQHARVAVAQTPYSAYPGAAKRLERLAGATTDLQFMQHQGMTHYDATFWVGANAVLRKRALDEVRQSSFDGDWEISRYIQDRTVIEDTESTIDLGAHGWTLLNYPERLSYSATPPDFGALCIQRRRWANGGLLILPKLRRQRKHRRRQGMATPFGELFLRVNYMASIAWGSLSLVLLLAYPFRNQLVSPLLGLIALPYFAAMASDLRWCGYKRTDVLRIYGFNLILLPVNMVGVGNSIVQAITGDKSVFGRTPKVRNRTVPNLMFIVAPYVIVALAAYTLYHDYRGDRAVNGVYAGLNTVLAFYAILAFIGLRNSVVDLAVQIKGLLYKPVKQPVAKRPAPASIVADPPSLDWASVLHFGGTDVQRLAGARRLVPAVQPGLSIPNLRGAVANNAHPTSPPPEVRITGGAGDEPSAPAGVILPPWGGSPPRRRQPSRSGPVAEEDFRTVFQPIVELVTDHTVGYEALSRFDDGIAPDDQLARAAADGHGVELEVLLTRAAVTSARSLPAGTWLALNVSIDLATAGRALQHAVGLSTSRLVYELDLRRAASLDQLRHAVSVLPPDGAIALAGVTAGYESLAVVTDLRPRYVKLDPKWAVDAHDDPARQALIGALVAVAADAGCEVIAEGIEVEAQREILCELGVRYGQGYLLGRPSVRPERAFMTDLGR